MSLWIKFCGIVRPDDFCYAVDLGVNAVGVIAIPNSPRCVNETELRILSALDRKRTQVVLVMENPSESFAKRMIDLAKPDLLQLHGSESPQFAESLSFPYIKATRESNFTAIFNQHRKAQYYLIDSNDFSGTLVHKDGLILAGGLDCRNIVDRVRHISPFGVDVSRGIQKTPREKDPFKMTDFFKLARAIIQ